MAQNQIISVFFKGIEVGKVGYDEHRRQSSFQYHPDFLEEDNYLNLFPYTIQKIKNIQPFRGLEGETFRGLPSFIADSLPDVFNQRPSASVSSAF